MQNPFQVLTIKEVKVKLGELIKLLRKKQGLTQEGLADKLGLSRITIQNIEAGRNATIDTMLKVMQYFDLLGQYFELITSEITNNSYESLY